MSMLEGSTAIVTGSTSGVGAHIAKMLANEGAKVVVCGTSEDEGQRVVDEIMADNGHAMFHYLDITDPGSLDDVVAATKLEWGSVDIMVSSGYDVEVGIERMLGAR